MLTSRAVQNNTDNSITRPEENMLIAVGGSTVRLATSATSVAASQHQHITLARLDAGQEEVGAQEQQLRINLNQREGMFAFMLALNFINILGMILTLFFRSISPIISVFFMVDSTPLAVFKQL